MIYFYIIENSKCIKNHLHGQFKAKVSLFIMQRSRIKSPELHLPFIINPNKLTEFTSHHGSIQSLYLELAHQSEIKVKQKIGQILELIMLNVCSYTSKIRQETTKYGKFDKQVKLKQKINCVPHSSQYSPNHQYIQKSPTNQKIGAQRKKQFVS